MAKLLMTIDLSEEQKPSVELIANEMKVSPSSIDEKYGIIQIDPENRTFAFLIDEDAIKKINPKDKEKIHGPYSNPKIEPFGPDES